LDPWFRSLFSCYWWLPKYSTFW